MRPMLATPADRAADLPRDAGRWAFEVKWDGMRVLADIRDAGVRITSRTERDVTVAFPELHPLGAVHPDLLLDGEVVVLADGVPSFAALADRIHVRDARRAAALAARAPATLVVFDVLRLYGVDLTGRPWQERRDTLERLEVPEGAWQVSPVYDDLDALLAATREHGLEGVVVKRRTSRYRPGARAPEWLKLAHKRVQSCVVGGWRPELTGHGVDARTVRAVRDRAARGTAGGVTGPGPGLRVGALLLGVPDPDGGLRFVGRMGSGLMAAGAQADLSRLLTPLAVAGSPFADEVPREDARDAFWVRPEVVVEVRHLGHTDGGRLRQPVFRGIRDDLRPEEVRPE